MNRLDEIKERVRLDGSKYYADLDYLLSLNERYEQALRDVVNAYGSEGTDIAVARKMVKIADKALEE